ncbi:helix-turn-helix domain-containing protein [Segnochrobactrum spirostomi]|nr:helix-turn-helix transcriptional regulator [Segnochrobactrum spirostomi]
MTKKEPGSADPAAKAAPASKTVEKVSEQDLMTPERFRAWRKSLGLKQKEAADRLGLKKRMIQYYEKGRRDGKSVVVPKTVRLACWALTNGVDDFDGTGPTAPVAAETQAAQAE